MKSFDERTEEILRRAESGAQTGERRRIIRLGAVYALSALLILAIGLTLFLPLDTGNNFTLKANSQYYELGKVVNDLTYTPPLYKNNFEKLGAALSESFSGCGSPSFDGDVGADMAPSGGSSSDSNMSTAPGSSASAEGYVENTDNQVEGVIEGDLLKRTTTHAFYYDKYSRIITAYSFAAGVITEVGRFTIGDKGYSFSSLGEIYLSADGRTLTVFTRCYDRTKGVQYACAIAVDVSSPQDMLEITRFYSSGDYVSSRYSGGEFLLVSNYKLRRDPNFNNEYEFLPQVGEEGEILSLPAENIVFSSDAKSATYTVVSKLSGDLTLKDSYAFLSYSEETYASQDNIYLTNASPYMPTDEVEYYTMQTTITCLNYSGEGLTLLGSGKVFGTILNQYSMDEYEDSNGKNLRVVTEATKSIVTGENASVTRYAKLYSISVDDFSTHDFFPDDDLFPAGESVQSVRFDKSMVYVCTAMTFVELTDPVFAIDISDYDSVTSTDTGTIPGYSMSLRTFKDGTLLGIGYGQWRSDLKISVYEEIDGKLEAIDLILEDCGFSSDYKAYFIDAERGIIGLAISQYNYTTYRNEYKYILVQYNGYSLEICEETEFDGNWDLTRAFYDDGYLYIVGPYETASIKYL